MYNKLHSRKNHVLLNILLSLPVLVLLAGVVLSEEKILISLIPFRKYLLYVTAAFLPAYLYYKFLMPLHETGHYLIAMFLKKKQHLDVEIWMDKKHTFCSNWRCYGNKEAKIILCAGMLFKFIYCIGIIFIFFTMNIKSGMITFIYVMWFELVLNAFPIQEEADGYKLIHIDVFYDEKINDYNVKEEMFVKKVYPWVLIGMTVATSILFSIMDNVLRVLVELF